MDGKQDDSCMTHTTSHGDEVVPQCEVWTQGGKGAKKLFDRCKLNPGHTQFMTWPQFEKASLPDCVTKQDKAQLRNFFDRTVRITVSYTSKDRPDTFANSDTPYPYSNMKGDKTERVGTGFLDFDYSLDNKYSTRDSRCLQHSKCKCPCPECKKSGNPKRGYWQMKVATASHVIFDKQEAENSVFTLFHDSDNEDDVKHLYGIRLFALGRDFFDHHNTDYVEIICVTHDPDLGPSLVKLLEETAAINSNPRRWGSLGVIISHPHGVRKLISVGNIYECCYIKAAYRDTFELKLRKGTSISRTDDDITKSKQSSQGTCATSESGNTIQPLDANTEKEGQEHKKTIESLILPFDSLLKIPCGAKFSYKYRYQDESRIILPRGSQLLTPDGKPLPLPSDSELSFLSENNLIYNFREINFLSFLTYDIATCPGSSGALLISSWILRPHFGRWPNQNLNLSGLGRMT